MKALAKENALTHLPIHIITGFLGSGKTTLLNQLLQRPGMEETVVIVNEFGEIGIDHLLVKATTEDMILLEGGCLCCSVRTDLVNTLEDLFQKRAGEQIPKFKQVIVETTGLADPAPILRTLINDAFIVRHYRLAVIITTVDAVYGAEQLDEYQESVKQAALANLIILTKIDLVTAAKRAILKQRLLRLNPSASIDELNLNEQKLDPRSLFERDCYNPKTQQLDVNRWLQADIYNDNQSPSPSPPPPPRSLNHIYDSHIKSFCIEHDEPLHWLTLEHWIQQLTRLRGKDLLRVKGIAYTYETDLPVLIQGVQHIFQPPVTLDAWPTDKRRSQIVFITRNIEKTTIERVLTALKNSQNPVDVCKAALILL
jgi:G3E family GTPase